MFSDYHFPALKACCNKQVNMGMNTLHSARNKQVRSLNSYLKLQKLMLTITPMSISDKDKGLMYPVGCFKITGDPSAEF